MGKGMDKKELAEFLRRRRELLRPAEVGLVEGRRRRTQGLRHEEAAQLAGMSTDHYALDNALMESQIGLYKTELIKRARR
ncbi:hypothetical protein [Streptomyces pseudovenezuelae]|uniref:Transcriptional regulator n=1 Tax=Streptomyces pseudovenezuelae TaxID=67350 RepID=A0ABT6LZH8_9ACTN|nr:hypothetical protein [Streptomyces pseudovenezuelae]